MEGLTAAQLDQMEQGAKGLTPEQLDAVEISSADPDAAEWKALGGKGGKKPPTDWETAQESLGQMVKPAPGTTPGTWEHTKGLGREAFLESNPLVNLGAWAIKKATGQKVKGDLELGSELKEKEPTFAESLSAGLAAIRDRPLTAGAELAKGLLYSPELAMLSFSRLPETVAGMKKLADIGRAGQRAAKLGVSMAEGGAAMAGVSALQQSAQKDEVNPGEVGASAVMGAAAIPVMRGVGKLFRRSKPEAKAGEPGEPGATPTMDHFTTTVGEGGDFRPAATSKDVAAAAKQADAQRRVDARAYELMQRGASKKEVEAAVKSDPALAEAMDRVRAKRADAAAAFDPDFGARQGEVLPPDFVEPKGGAQFSPDSGQRALPAPSGVGRATPEMGQPKGPGNREGGAVDPELLKRLGIAAGVTGLAAWAAVDEKVADRLKGAGLLGAAALSIKGKGGNWAPRSVEVLSGPLKSALTHNERFGVPDIALRDPNAPIPAAELHSDRMVVNYLNKHAGTEGDPLKDVRLPNGERWEDVTDKAITKSKVEGPKGEEDQYRVGPNPQDNINRTDQAQVAQNTLASHMSHVGDYLRQNVDPADLPKYDLVRAVKETAARDEKVKQEAHREFTEPKPERIAENNSLPVVMDFPPTQEGKRQFNFHNPKSTTHKSFEAVDLPAEEVQYSWRELKLPEKLTEEQARSIDGPMGKGNSRDAQYMALDAKGRGIINNFTKEPAQGATPEQAWLAGQLAKEGNALGHCVGGYAEEVVQGNSRILSLRDQLGRSYGTVEVEPAPKLNNGFPSPDAPSIPQIKGPGNGALPPYVHKYVQELLNSREWGVVRNLENAGLKDTATGNPAAARALEAQGVKGRYVDAQKFAEAERTARDAYYGRGQAGKASTDQLLTLLGVSLGAMAGAYLAGDDKIAGAVVGAVGGGVAALTGTRLPAVASALGKTLSYKQAVANSAKIGAVLATGGYMGSKSDNTVEGIVIASAILLGRNALPKARTLTTDDMMRVRNGSIASWGRITANLKREIGTTVPDLARREAISDALDQGSPAGLSAAERRVYDVVKEFNRQLGHEAADASVIKGMRSNYISYIVERDPSMTPEQQEGIIKSLFTSGAFSDSASPNTKFGKQGKYETFNDLNNALKGSGLKLKTKDVAEIISIYGKAMRTAIENKLLIDGMKKAKTAGGETLLATKDKNGNLPFGYKTLPHPQLQGYGIHPDLYDSARVLFDNSDPNVATRAFLGLSMATKRIRVAESLFHAKSLTEVYILAMGSEFYSKGFAPIKHALKMFHEGGLGDVLDLGLKNGLGMKIPDDVSVSIINDLGKKLDQFVPLKAGTAVTDKIDWVNRKIDKLTWDTLHAGIKGALFMKEFETLTLRNAEAHAKNPEKVPLKTRDQIARETAKYVNDLAGGLDWFGIAADAKTQFGREAGMFFASPSGRRLAQIIMFAPDWALSTLRSGFGAVGHSDTGVKGLWKPENATDLYRRYALRSTLYWLTLINGMNILASGQPIWKNDDPTHIQFADKTVMQVGKHTFETYHAMENPVKFAYYKLGYTPQMLFDAISGKEGFGTKAPAYDSFPQHMVKSVLPFTASAAMQEGLTPGQRVRRGVASTLGFPVYGVPEDQKPALKAERKEKKLLKRRRKEGYDE